MVIMDHDQFMHRCLELAERGRGTVGNGAMVGVVLVRGDAIIDEAYHQGFGMVHAERGLLTQFRGEIQSSDVLYVNLEPCCHVGKTPACTDIIIDRGVRHLVFGMWDPDPRVLGKGVKILQEKGVEVIGPVLPELCARLNRGFVSVRTQGRPWVTLKMAQTPDGGIANADGSPRKITSGEQDQWSHTFLRAKHDAILVGVETVVKDDPVLTVRCIHPTPDPLILRPKAPLRGPLLSRRERENVEHPWRIVLDPHLRIPLHVRVVSDGGRERTVVVRTKELKEIRERAEGPDEDLELVEMELAEWEEIKEVLIGRGVRVVEVPVDRKGRFVWRELWKVLTEPSGNFHGITSILVEGGRKTWKIFKEAGMVDEIVILVGA